MSPAAYAPLLVSSIDVLLSSQIFHKALFAVVPLASLASETGLKSVAIRGSSFASAPFSILARSLCFSDGVVAVLKRGTLPQLSLHFNFIFKLFFLFVTVFIIRIWILAA